MMAVTLLQVQAALVAYDGGDSARALELLSPHYAPMSEADLMAAVPCTAVAVRDWVALACDRLRSELGEDVIAVCPVRTALGTAARLLSE